MLEEILKIDFQKLGEKDPLRLIQNQDYSTKTYISHFEEYITGFLKKYLPDFNESVIGGTESSGILSAKNLKITLTDKKGVEKIKMEYNKETKPIIDTVKKIGQVFSFLTNSNYKINEIPPNLIKIGQFNSSRSSLNLLEDQNNIYSDFFVKNQHFIYKIPKVNL